MAYYVSYKVEGFRDQKVGPYDTLKEAQEQSHDIMGYMGVSDVLVVEEASEPKTRFDLIG